MKMMRNREAIFNALQQQIEICEDMQRASGRSSEALYLVKEHDIFVVHSHDFRNWAEAELHNNYKYKDVIVAVAKTAKEVLRIQQKYGAERRIIFDNAAEYLILKDELQELETKFTNLNMGRPRIHRDGELIS